jgi:DNA-binding response OmpR family regulator
MKILIVEDEPALLKSLGEFAKKEGFLYDQESNYHAAMEKVALYDYDCIILDINLPDGSGFELLQELHSQRKTGGVLILSARDSLDDKVKGLGLGADDYLTKPFFFSELNARIKAIVRRKQFNTNHAVTFGNISIDLDQRVVKVQDQLLSLTKKEYEILTHLISNKKRVVTKTALAEYIWGDYFDQMDSFDFLFSHIKNLKRKLKETKATVELINIYGVGYQLKKI